MGAHSASSMRPRTEAPAMIERDLDVGFGFLDGLRMGTLGFFAPRVTKRSTRF
jgi:hypothetical protein